LIYILTCFISRFDITLTDVFRGLSDNENAELAVSRNIIVGKEIEKQSLYRYIYEVDFAMKYALCINIRTIDEKQVDVYQPIVDLMKKAEILGSFVMETTTNSNFTKMSEICLEICGESPTHIVLSNHSCVFSCYKMILSLLRNKMAIDLFIENTKETLKTELLNVKLDDNDWQNLAEIECIFEKINEVLTYYMQTDSSEWQGFTLYIIYATKEELWGANVTYKPMDIMKTWKPRTALNDIPKVSLEANGLQEIAKTVLLRLQDEYFTYSSNVDGDIMIATLLHPVSGAMGIWWMSFWGKCNIEDYKQALLVFLLDLFEEK